MKRSKIKVLIGCESSGIVREAFRKKGFDAWSCDLSPTEIEGPHLQEDLREVMRREWDCMIAHPPCTYLSNCGSRWMYIDRDSQTVEERILEQRKARTFFMDVLNADIACKAIENPGYLGMVCLPKHTQTIQPYQFGHIATKRTCLWLKNLPLLVPTRVIPKEKRKSFMMILATRNSVDRSRTFTGIASAMADQWGRYLDKI